MYSMMHHSVRRLLYGFLLLCASASASAIPQFSLISGNRCSGCHVNVQGSGLRTNLGWYSYMDVSMIPREGSFLSGLYAGDESNQFLDDKLTLGMDIRVQNTRSFYDSAAPRTTFPMQANIYASYDFAKEFMVEGSFNFAALRKAPNSTEVVRYPGQRAGTLSAIFKPSDSLPMLRVGFFRPAIGLRWDDHTAFTNSYVTGTSRQALVAPMWAEYGAEISYESLKWLTVQAGVFGSSGLSELKFSDGKDLYAAFSGNAPTYTARVMVWPRAFDDKINMFVGASGLVNYNLGMVNAWAGVGLTDWLALQAEFMHLDRVGVLQANNITAELMVQVWSPLLPYVRYEHGETKRAQVADVATVNSIILGAQLFPIPYVEIRPEYRIWDTALPGYTSRWNVQLHIFY
jgi:hypothetical protein